MEKVGTFTIHTHAHVHVYRTGRRPHAHICHTVIECLGGVYSATCILVSLESIAGFSFHFSEEGHFEHVSDV